MADLVKHYLCQNPHMTDGAVRATVDGQEMTVTVPMLECDLVSQDMSFGGIKVRLRGGEVEGGKALFVNDAPITVTFAGAEKK
jgi:hypothetical protein